MIDILVIPNRLENAIGETHDHEVLDGFLAKIVIDTKNLRFVEHAARNGIDRLSCGQIASNRLFDDDAGVRKLGGWCPGKACLRQAFADRSERARGNAEIEDSVAGQLK